MVQFRNVHKVDLSAGSAPVIPLRQLHYADVNADRVGAMVYADGEPVTLIGICSGTAIRADGSTVPITGGVVEGNLAYVELPAECYAIEGPIQVFVTLTEAESVTTLLAAMGTVKMTETGTVIDPGDVLPSVNALITAILEAVASIPADYSALLASIAPTFSPTKSGGYNAGDYVWYSGTLYQFTADHTGSWTGTDATSSTVAAGLNTGVVKYDAAQTLTDAQKLQARQNIGAASGSGGDTSELEARIDALAQFVNYTDIATFTMSPASVEIGSASASVALAWTFNSTPSSLTLNGVSKSVSSTGETVTAADDGSTHKVEYTLATSSGSRKVTFNFWPKVYYGAAAIPESVNSAFLLGLSNGALAGSRARTFTVNAGSGQYIWYASPVNYGDCAFSVGGFDGGFEAAQTVSVTNASGYTQNYYVYRASNANLGSTTVVVK